ncbi:hypothetical protein AGENTSMITH_166 [Bacillus phage vB_BspM_AgentSmith]|nr:hypothetical protein AGENTSMITH_166 [Bacillus phage vB_BspM_AgentSmith]
MLKISSVQDDLSSLLESEHIVVCFNDLYKSVGLNPPTKTLHMDLFLHHAYCPTVEIDTDIEAANPDLDKWDIAVRVDMIEVILSKVYTDKRLDSILQVYF